ncbi:hypothetical protein SAMN05192583_1590 [Sphingomonas gellani]|uniref:RimK-like ATP-grasp domain-containing protein n=1 Tax=Sphingomonas gellani TaxID=1166340 RepID=A0A1H8CEX8_9SPHN|nr:RimK-like protein [Sphingomonas gellani]SEM93821.1 hypothetical protein SAMN05192583_1590 [Sphingomonas gellani]
MAHQVEVLILTSDLDFATDRVCRELTRRGRKFLRLNREQLGDVLLALDPTEPRLTCRHDGRTWTVGSELRSVWWRQGTFDRNVAGNGAEVEDQLQRSQWSAFMRSMMVFDDARWFNCPSAVYRAEIKALQLAAAAEVGFDVPRTVMTNDPDINPPAADGLPVAIKSVDTLLLRDGPDQLFGYTSIMDWKDAALPELTAALTVQQALMNKLDLRVTVVEDRLWCTSIKRAGEGIEVDWRLTGKDQLEIVDHVLSDEDANRCREFVARLGLRYGAIDLAVAAGRSWFIEINPTGEWGWVDGETRPIAAAIAVALSCSR